MEKLNIISLLSASLLIISSLPPLTCSKRNVTNIRVYLQDQFNMSQPISYGDVFAFEGLLTVGPSPNSTLLGNARGTIAFSNANRPHDIHVSIAYIFSAGKYSGSTVVAVGMNDWSQSTREFPIVGGTGKFRLARGVVTATTYSEEPLVFIHDLGIVLDKCRKIELCV